MSENNKALIPKVSRIYATAGSTNALAVRALAEGPPPPEGTVIRALAQTAGRGQGTNGWHASPGQNLTFSLVAYPTWLPLSRLFVLNQIASLAVAGAVAAYCPDETEVRVKWPNDVLVDNRKIAGILIQNGLRGTRLAWSVIGIGLNVNESNFPVDLMATTTSLGRQTDQPLLLDDVLTAVLNQLATNYNRALDNGLDELNGQYHHRLYRKGQLTNFYLPETDEQLQATITGVSQDGQLQLIDTQREQLSYRLRAIKMQPPTP